MLYLFTCYNNINKYKGQIIMKKNIKNYKIKQKHNYKECGAISCINNICGLCNTDNCELYEDILMQED